MKTLTMTLVILIAGIAQAQSRPVVCGMNQMETEARDYVHAASNGKRIVQSCLQTEINRVTQVRGKGPLEIFDEQVLVMQILENIAADKQQGVLSSLIKCESTNTPNCGSNINMRSELFSPEELQTLDREADLKRGDDVRNNEGLLN